MMFKVILFGQEDKHCDFYQQRGKLTLGLPRRSWWERTLLSMQETKRGRISLWVGKVPWRKVWQPTPGFLPGDSRGKRSLAGYSP